MPSASAIQASLPLWISAPVQEIVHRHLAVEHGKHGRAARRRAALAPGVLADPVLVVSLTSPFLMALNTTSRSSASSCWRVRAVRLRSSRQHAAAGGLDQDCGRGIAVKAVLDFLLAPCTLLLAA